MRIFAASVSGQNSSEGIAVCPGMKKTYENISYSEYGTTGRYQGAA